jgi:hypothetical protein
MELQVISPVDLLEPFNTIRKAYLQIDPLMFNDDALYKIYLSEVNFPSFDNLLSSWCSMDGKCLSSYDLSGY